MYSLKGTKSTHVYVHAQNSCSTHDIWSVGNFLSFRTYIFKTIKCKLKFNLYICMDETASEQFLF